MTRNGKAIRVTHTLDTLPDHEVQLWIAKAQQHIARQGWSYDEFDYAELCYTTAMYLMHIDSLLVKARTFPCYAVHSAEDDSRFESGSYSIALDHFKRMDKDLKRVALFHWPSKHEHKRLYASDGYPYDRDFGPRED